MLHVSPCQPTAATPTTTRAGASDSSVDRRASPSTASRAPATASAPSCWPGSTLDEWGYPVVTDDRVDPGDGRPVDAADAADAAVRLCPARALYLR